MEKFYYLGNMISCYCGTSEAVSTRIGSAWRKFRELSGVLVGKQGLFLKQQGRFISIVLDQFCCTVVKRGNLLLRMTRMTSYDQDDVWGETGPQGIDWSSSGWGECFCEDRRYYSKPLRWYGHVIHRDINSQMREVMELEINGKGRRVDQGNRGKSA